MATIESAGTMSRSGEYSIPRFLTLLFQFALFLLVIYWLDLESRAFLHLGILGFVGFAVHYFLPLRFRLPFFLLLSLVGIETVFGFQLERWSAVGLAQGAWLIAIGVAIVAITRLPIRFSARLALVAAAGGLLALFRAEALPAPWSSAIWPVLGSMFMFRLIVYLYDLRYAKEKVSLTRALSYFFMLPNVCFPLFPVVDFQTFCRTYYDHEDRHQIYQTGMFWMFRGVTHLILYRFLYHHVVVSAEAVQSLPDLLRYLVWPYLLYLRVSGQFHIIVGLMRMFGFALPETNHLYYLASSFTDCWRRINIYWKDFMLKVFYYPAFFKLRGLGNTSALVLATFFVFFVTWFLHSYQWFWIRGSFLVRWNDAVFWTVLALLVAANALYEVKHGRHRALETGKTPLRVIVYRASGTVGTFSVVCVLWSLWNAPSLAEWLSVWSVIPTATPAELWSVPAALLAMALVALGGTLAARAAATRSLGFTGMASVVVVAQLGILALTSTPFYRVAGLPVRGVIADLRSSDLNRQDRDLLSKGYYENLLDVSQFNHELWEVYRTRPADWVKLNETEAVRWRDDLPRFELIPSVAVGHNGVTVRTNSWGMRDREYDPIPPANAHRVALLGSSLVMGNGVENEETFDNVLEERLNRDADRGVAYEILNFGVGGYTPIDQLAVLEDRVLDLEPSMVLFFAQSWDLARATQHVTQIARKGVDHQYSEIERFLERAGADGEKDHPKVIRRKLKAFEVEILSWVYRRAVEASRERGILAAWAYLPMPEVEDDAELPKTLRRVAREAGFVTIDLSDVYDGHDLESLWIARWDHHPNAEGHRLIADLLGRRLQEAQLVQGADLLGGPARGGIKTETHGGDDRDG